MPRPVQLAIHGPCGFTGDPLYASRRTVHTGRDLLTDRQLDRLHALLSDNAHVEVEVTWGIYQRLIEACRTQDRSCGRIAVEQLIKDVSAGVPKALIGVSKVGRPLVKRADDVLAYFERPGISKHPQKRSTADSNTYVAARSVSATSPTT